jgi:hypothetical protein
MIQGKSTGYHLMHYSWIDDMVDALSEFDELVQCPDCGCLTKETSLRCPECGLFHYNLDELGEREPPPIEQIIVEKPDLNPALYSLNPNSPLPVSEDEEDHPDPTKNWSDSSNDFAFKSDDRPLHIEKSMSPINRGETDE